MIWMTKTWTAKDVITGLIWHSVDLEAIMAISRIQLLNPEKARFQLTLDNGQQFEVTVLEVEEEITDAKPS